MNTSQSHSEVLSDSVEDFALSVEDEFENLKDNAVQGAESRIKDFINSNLKRLLGTFENSSWVTKTAVTGGVGILAYYGMKVAKWAMDGIFGIGHWIKEKLNLRRNTSLKKILKIILGVGAIALIPLLYQGIKIGQLRITDIVKAWQKDGSLGIFSLLSSQFPEGLANMSQDVINYFKKYLSEKVLGEGIEKAKEKVGQAQERVQDKIGQAKKAAKSVTRKSRKGETQSQAEDTISDEFEIKAKELKKAIEDEGVKKTFERLVNDNAALVLKNGSLYILNSVGELLDLSRWLTLQWVDSMNEVKLAILDNPEKWFGALTRQYLEESVNFMVLATGVDFVHSFFDRSKAIQPLKSVIAGVTSGMKWGAYPFKLMGAAKRAYPVLAEKGPKYIRFIKGGAEFLGKGGKPVAKATVQAGKLVFWEGGKWAVVKAAESVGKKEVLAKMGQTISRKYQETIGKRLTELAGKEMMQTVLKSLGWRGAALSAMVADDAIPIVGWLDIVLEVGLGAWLSYDVYQFVKRYRNVLKFNELKKSQDLLPISSVEILDQPSRDAFDLKLKSLGKKESELSPEDYQNLLDTLPLVRFKMIREDHSTEIYTIKRGNIVNVTITDKSNNSLVHLENEDIDMALKSIPAPETNNFKKWDIDYKQSSETLTANYKEALRYIKNETAWQQIQMDIIDTRTIRIFRADTGTESYITRKSDNRWYISEYPKTGFDFFQALSMTNLINRVDDLIKGYWIKGSKNPFYTEDGDIYYGRTGKDIKILSGDEKSWKKFFNDMNVTDENIIDLLNHFHNEKK